VIALLKANGRAKRSNRQMADYLHTVLEKDVSLKAEAQKLADEIHLEVTNDSSSMIQNNDGGTNYQTKPGANNKNFFGGSHSHS